MIEHIVCFKLKPETTDEQAQRLITMLMGMKGQIPEIVDISAGKTFTPERGKGFSVGLVVRFRDRAGLEAYLPHPVHLPVKAYAGSISEDSLAMDYEF